MQIGHTIQPRFNHPAEGSRIPGAIVLLSFIGFSKVVLWRKDRGQYRCFIAALGDLLRQQTLGLEKVAHSSAGSPLSNFKTNS